MANSTNMIMDNADRFLLGVLSEVMQRMKNAPGGSQSIIALSIITSILTLIILSLQIVKYVIRRSRRKVIQHETPSKPDTVIKL